jgi:simple sugar transport system permease protein
MIHVINTFVYQTVLYATVYTLAALGILIAGRTGIFIIFGEGIMLTAASMGLIFAQIAGNWFIGFLIGAVVGGVLGLLFIAVHESFKINQFLLGVIFFILGTGLSDLIYKIIVGVTLVPPIAPATPGVESAFLTKIPVLSGFLNQNIFVYFMYGAIIITWWFYYKTKIGLATRAIGEDPKAADVVGVNVVRRRYLATIIGSALIGIAGAYLPIVIIRTYSTGMVGGRGFMAIGIAIFASWRPQRALLGGLLFAGVEVLSFQLQILAKNVPYQLFLMLPFFAVIVIMMIFRKRIEFPASVGKPYSRE